ncbi:hypothetical protein WK76_10875 [Burkholderia ubonensis]|uniref:hypothetical protein n=1 Tax=Burkholderia ubonensis TaxID=101571 RepID=UPI000754C698|nr:hypothetical protein [Burkholderia ubonensis]KVU94131.1 hypothetical protein WK76_10875 [Burkholderia ubonensis]
MLTLVQARTLSISGAALPTYSTGGLPVFVPVRLLGSEAVGRLEACRYLVTLRTDHAFALSPSVTASRARRTGTGSVRS